MLLPKLYRSMEDDYHHLKSAVQIWDVACERQIEIVGPDARRLVQMATPRDISGMKDDQCYYIPAVDARGRMLNDPVLIRLADDRYWVSIADSDLLLYYDGLAAGAGLDVCVFEPDVSPLAIQGPKSDDLIRRVFGHDIAAVRFFRHKPLNFLGKEMIISRSGYSVQGGFEIYVDGSEHAEPLWDALFEAGRDLDVRGDDFTMENTPFEAGLGKFCDLDKDTGFLGREALMSQQEPVRTIRPVEIEGSPIPLMTEAWPSKSMSRSRW
jgi:dimethylsulfoniopropionate demethylase